MSDQCLQELGPVASDFGWRAKLPGAPLLFGKEVTLFIFTGIAPMSSAPLPSISLKQAALVHSIIPALQEVIRRVEEELSAYEPDLASDANAVFCNPQVWLDSEDNDCSSWTLIVERSDWEDYGYHAEFKGTEFVELWAGD
jgi:hypothetical protein